MKWALVSTEPVSFGRFEIQESGTDIFGNPAKANVWVNTEAPENTIINIIVYDGVSEYTPPENTVLMEVADELHIGDIIE